MGDDGTDIKSIIAAADTNKDGTIDYEVRQGGRAARVVRGVGAL